MTSEERAARSAQRADSYRRVALLPTIQITHENESLLMATGAFEPLNGFHSMPRDDGLHVITDTASTSASPRDGTGWISSPTYPVQSISRGPPFQVHNIQSISTDDWISIWTGYPVISSHIHWILPDSAQGFKNPNNFFYVSVYRSIERTLRRRY